MSEMVVFPDFRDPYVLQDTVFSGYKSVKSNFTFDLIF